MKLKSDPRVEEVFDNYPDHIKPKMDALRKLILDAATDIAGVDSVEETLKWGEPSYLTKHGSTIRIDWKTKTPDQYAIYFKCTSKLVPTFKEIYGDFFKYENTRAILFDLEEVPPANELKQCIAAALMYHKVKTKENLGINQ